MLWPKTRATYIHVHLEFPDKVDTSKDDDVPHLLEFFRLKSVFRVA